MTNEEICQAAYHLVCEPDTGQEGINADYLQRSGYLLAAVCRECETAENAYRAANGKSPVSLPDTLCYQMSTSFPLSAALSGAAAFGVASLLVADENPDLSADFRDRFRQELDGLLASLPMQSAPIVDRYPAVWQ